MICVRAGRIASGDTAEQRMSSSHEIPLILRCAVVQGIIRKSSWSWPVALSPLGFKVPSTRNG